MVFVTVGSMTIACWLYGFLSFLAFGHAVYDQIGLKAVCRIRIHVYIEGPAGRGKLDRRRVVNFVRFGDQLGLPVSHTRVRILLEVVVLKPSPAPIEIVFRARPHIPQRVLDEELLGCLLLSRFLFLVGLLIDGAGNLGAGKVDVGRLATYRRLAVRLRFLL
jgi:hypothetical protein